VDKIKLTEPFRCLLSHANWNAKDEKIYKSLLDWHDKHGGLTVKQTQLLGSLYSRYGEGKTR